MSEISQDSIREKEIALAQTTLVEIENLERYLKTKIVDLENNNSVVVEYNKLKKELRDIGRPLREAIDKYKFYKLKYCDHRFLPAGKVYERVSRKEPKYHFYCLKCGMLLTYGKREQETRDYYSVNDDFNLERECHNLFPFGPDESQIIPLYSKGKRADYKMVPYYNVNGYRKSLYYRVMEYVPEDAPVEVIAEEMNKLAEQDNLEPIQVQMRLKQ